MVGDLHLPVVEAGVEALTGDQVGVRPLLDDPAMIDHGDAVGPADRGQPVGDDERHAAAHQALERLHQHGFGQGVER